MTNSFDDELLGNQRSGCGRFLLWMFFLALILSCLCCAGIIGSGYYIGNALKNGYIEDPVIAQQKTEDAFGELNLPGKIKPRSFLAVNLFGKELGFVGIYSWNVVGEPVLIEEIAPAEPVFIEEAAPAEESVLAEEAAPAEESVLAEEADPVQESVLAEEADPEEETIAKPEESTEKPVNDKGLITFYSLSDSLKFNEQELVNAISERMTSGSNVTVKRTDKATVTINGAASEFTFSWIENKDSQIFLMASGSFVSKTGKPCNVLVCLPGNIPQETVVKVLENIQK